MKGNLSGLFRDDPSDGLILHVTCRMSEGLPDRTVGRASQGMGTCIKPWLTCAATWMDLEIIVLNQKETNIHDITYMWSLEHNRNERIYETEIDSQV